MWAFNPMMVLKEVRSKIEKYRRDAQKRRPWTDGGGDWGDAPVTLRLVTPRMASIYQMLEEAKKDPSRAFRAC